MTSSLTAIALAGGQSRRMGQDKALLQIDGVSLLRRTCEVALHFTPLVYVITPQPEIYRLVVPQQCQLIQESQSPDLKPQGPLIGFAQALAQVKAEWVLVLACDLPFLDAAILQRWMGQLADTDRAIALLPYTQKGWEPLCGFYRTSCLPSLSKFIYQGGRSFQVWLGSEIVQAIAFSCVPSEFQQEQRMLFNCNTPEDLAMALQENSLQGNSE